MAKYDINRSEMIGPYKVPPIPQSKRRHTSRGQRKAGATISNKRWIKALEQRMKENGL